MGNYVVTCLRKEGMLNSGGAGRRQKKGGVL